MNIAVKEYHSLTDSEKSQFFKFLKQTKDTNISPAAANMFDDYWVNKPNTLPYILEATDRFFESSGQFNILFDDDKIFACGGVYKSQFDNTIAIAGSRTWIDEQYRHNSILREYLLPHHKRWAITNNCVCVLLCFNEYNKNIIEVFKRRRLGEKLDRINTRNSEHMFYNGLNELDFPVNIQYTKQWIIYEKLSENFSYDWDNIKWQG